MEDSDDKVESSRPGPGEVTVILARASAGDPAAADILLPLVYTNLRAIAGAYFQAKPANHTLQPTALVHEAYLKLVDSSADWKDRAHFCAVAATAMRQILSNHAQSKRTAKRDAKRVELTVDDLATPTGASTLDLLDLDEALNELSTLNARHSRIVELRFFGGLTVDAMAEVLGLSSSMVRREWRVVRAWLSCRLSLGEAP